MAERAASRGFCHILVSPYRLPRLISVRSVFDSAFSGYTNFCIVRPMETVTHTDSLVRFGHALADATRARILLSLNRAPGYPSELAEQLGVSRQILSNHLTC